MTGLSFPLSLLDPSTWKHHHPDTLPADFNPREANGFYVHHRLIRCLEPIQVLDETDWGNIETLT